MEFISYLQTNGVGVERFKDAKTITPQDLFLSTLVNEEGEPVAPEYPHITHKMMFNEYKQEPFEFMWALIKTPFRAVIWFINNVFKRLLSLGFTGALLTVIYQTAIGKTFSEATILHEFWRFMVMWMLFIGLVWFIVFIMRMMLSVESYTPRWKHELWVPPFAILWELQNDELVAHHYHADLGILSSENYPNFVNMPYNKRFELGYLNGLINVQWPMKSIVVDEAGEKVGEHFPEGPDMLYLSEFALKLYELNNPDPRIRLERDRKTYLEHGESY